MGKALSILVVSGTYPPDIGGSELSVHTACVKMQERGHNVVVIADDRRPDEYEHEGITVIGVPQGRLDEEMDRQNALHNFDVVITQLIYSPEALRWASNHGIPSVYYIRNTSMFINLTVNAPYSPTVLLANAEFTAEIARNRWHRDPVVLYPFIDTSKTTPEVHDPKCITLINPLALKGGKLFRELAIEFPDRPFLGAIGWTGLRKREDNSWDPRQWALMAQAHNDPSVRPPEEVDFSDVPNITILNAVQDMKSVYAETRILLFPAQWDEPFGRTIVEALAAGIPVISTDVGGIKETGLKDGGIYLERSASLDEWKNAIIQLDDADLYEQMVQSTQTDIRWYSLEALTDKLEQICWALEKLRGLKKYTWTTEAQSLLRKAAEIPATANVIMVIRHSQRKEPTQLGMVNEIPLTEEGRIVAREFGALLPEGWNYRIFYSEIERCRETAELIEGGLKDKGLNCESMGPLGVLKGMAGVGSQIEKLAHRDKHTAVLKWAAGHYPETVIEPLHSYAQRAAYTIWNNQKQAEPPTMDILVSHDLHIMALQFGWSGEWVQDEWVDYLGGFILQLGTDNLVIYKNDRRMVVPYPFWRLTDGVDNIN